MYVQSASPKSLSDLDSVFGWKAPGSGPDLRDMIQEFQGLRVGIAAGSTQSAALLVRNSGGTTNNLALISSRVLSLVLLSMPITTSFMIDSTDSIAFLTVLPSFLSIITSVIFIRIYPYCFDYSLKN